MKKNRPTKTNGVFGCCYVTKISKFDNCGFDLLPLSETILYSLRLACFLSVVQCLEVVHISEIENILVHGKVNRGHVIRLLHRGYPYFRKSIVGDFTVQEKKYQLFVWPSHC